MDREQKLLAEIAQLNLLEPKCSVSDLISLTYNNLIWTIYF